VEIVTNNFEFLENGLGLSLVVFFPLVSALIVALMPKKQEVLIKLTALGSSIITFILSVIVAIQFDYSKAEQFQLGSKLSWIEVSILITKLALMEYPYHYYCSQLLLQS